MREYDVGDLVKTTATFTDPDDGSALDPDSVFLRVEDPDGTITEYEYDGNNGDLDETDRIWRSEAGIYHFNIDLVIAGVHYYYWYSTGHGQAADRGHFKATPGVDSPIGT